MFEWHHQLDGVASGVGNGQGNLGCCHPWGHKESDRTERLTELMLIILAYIILTIQVQSLDWEDLLEKEMAPMPLFLPGKSHGQRNLIGYGSWGCKESDSTELLHFHFLSL